MSLKLYTSLKSLPFIQYHLKLTLHIKKTNFNRLVDSSKQEENGF